VLRRKTRTGTSKAEPTLENGTKDDLAGNAAIPPGSSSNAIGLVNSAVVKFYGANPILSYRKGPGQEELMQDHDVRPSGLTRRRVLGGMGIASLALMSSPALAQETVDLHVPGGPSTRIITTSYPQKGRMILQRSSPPWLETPFEVFDKGVFTPNDQHYVSWHWANFPGDIDVDSYRLTVRGHVNQTLSLSLKDILQGLPRVDVAAVNQCAGASRIYFVPRIAGAMGKWVDEQPGPVCVSRRCLTVPA
jgi:hypothetical protein